MQILGFAQLVATDAAVQDSKPIETCCPYTTIAGLTYALIARSAVLELSRFSLKKFTRYIQKRVYKEATLNHEQTVRNNASLMSGHV